MLERQPDHFKRFLLGTSILERMTAPLCDAVLGIDDAAGSLEALARSNAFVVPLDDRREWSRYHHLFRDLLRMELKRCHPELLPVSLKRAAGWCEPHGSPGEAFAYAYESGDLAQAGRIVLAYRDEFARRGQIESLRLWLERCTDKEIASDPQLSIAAVWVWYLGGAARARRFVAAAERGPVDVASADGASSLRSALANVRTALAPDGIPQMLRDAELVYASEKKAGTRWLLSGYRAMGVAYVLLGRPQEAITVLREALALSSHEPELAHARVFSLGYLAFAAAEMANWRDAQRWAVEATWLVAEAHLHETVYGAIAYTAGALAQQQRGDHTEAARELENVRRLRPRLRGARWLNADLALRCADISLNLGELAGALEFAQVADDALQGYPDAGTLPARLQRLERRISRGQDYGLTPAELRLVAFLPTHLSLQEIADRLHLARPTVKTHVASIYQKLGVPGRSEAVEIVKQLGLRSTEPKSRSQIQISTEVANPFGIAGLTARRYRPFWPMPDRSPGRSVTQRPIPQSRHSAAGIAPGGKSEGGSRNQLPVPEHLVVDADLHGVGDLDLDGDHGADRHLQPPRHLGLGQGRLDSADHCAAVRRRAVLPDRLQRRDLRAPRLELRGPAHTVRRPRAQDRRQGHADREIEQPSSFSTAAPSSRPSSTRSRQMRSDRRGRRRRARRRGPLIPSFACAHQAAWGAVTIFPINKGAELCFPDC